jgi:nucleotide-binding universal stress UspA family protein
MQKNNVFSEFQVLFATDGSAYSDFAAEKLAELIDFNRAKVSVVNVRVPIEVILPQDAFSYADLNKITEESEIVAKEIVKDTALTLAKNRFEITKKYQLSGDPAGEILEECKPSKYDLIVAGAQGKNEIAGFFMGSVSSKIYDRSKIPVLIVKKR